MNSDDLTNGFFVAVFERKFPVNITTQQQQTDKIETPKPGRVKKNTICTKKCNTKKRNYKHCPVTENIVHV